MSPSELHVSVWRGGAEGGYQAFRVPRAQSQTVLDVVTYIQRELDPERRAEIEHEFHRYIYDLQPYLFMINPPKKFAMNKALRGHQCFMISPGYDPRRWYYPAGTEGTRETPK